jgi:topoisomerase-4 subunit A
MTQQNIIYFEDALKERYLSYALSTIMSRSLPDVRDGLKPVHRRLIFGMHALRLSPQSTFKKSARIVGDVLGKFHPHGDGSIYDALVRLAQEFSVRYPLIEGQGNFGSVDGDQAAAMRYTEARLTPIALLLLEGIDDNCVPFKSTYDGTDEEPNLLPAVFPNLLANGSSGIAVGMATSIPPHNLTELMGALIHRVDNPNSTISELLEFIKGPDFPTGGILVETKESIQKSYETGRGSFRLRARYEKENLPHGQYRIIIYDIPYQSTKSKIIEKIAQLLEDKKLPWLQDIWDESEEKIRIVLEPKSRQIEPAVLMEHLFRMTDLEIRFSLNMNVLEESGAPRVMSIADVLDHFLKHRRQLLLSRTEHRLSNICARLEVLDGLLICYLNIDEVIQIIRDEDDPKEVLQKRFALSDTQVESILNMRLRSLRKIQEIEIQKEHNDLSIEKNDLTDLLEKPKKQWTLIKKDFNRILKDYGDERRTLLEDLPTLDLEDISPIEKEDVTVVCSTQGWIRTFKGHQIIKDDIKYKEGDHEWKIIPTDSTQKLILFATNGRFYSIPVDKLPKGRGQGDPIRLFIDLENQESILHLGIAKMDDKFLLIRDDGRGFAVNANDVIAQTRSGKQILTTDGTIKARLCLSFNGDHLAIIGSHRKLLVLKADDIPSLQKGQGVILQKYKGKETISDVKFFNGENGLTWTRANNHVVEKQFDNWIGKRGAIGKLAPIRFPRSNKFNDIP